MCKLADSLQSMIKLIVNAIMLVIVLAVPAGFLHADEAEQNAFFESRIRPVLIKHCYECHAADSEEISGGLRVDSAPGLKRGGDSGTAIVAGDPDASSLIEAIRYDGVEMPPDGRLSENVIADFEKWVETGAFDPRVAEPDAQSKSPQRVIDIEEGKKFWSFQPVQRFDRPAVENEAWPRSDIDAFVLAKLESNKLKPSADADRRTLVRRLYFDLTGLPPTPEEMADALDDQANDAINRLVDKLLASPQFGVHWGRHWLDVARYADSNGGDFNATFHYAWKYRDYVIAAFNDDKPFYQFVREQIAGDLLGTDSDADSDEEKSQKIIATGFLMLGAKMLSERDKEKLTMDVVDEQLNTIGQTFMGMTVGCARCHDHKFDPIPTSDYYAMAGILRSTRTLQGESQEYVSTWPRRVLPASEERIKEVANHEAVTKKLNDKIKKEKTQRDKIASDIKKLKTNIDALVIDDAKAKLTGVWKASTFSPAFFGEGYVHDNESEKGEKFAEFTFGVPNDAIYDVQISYTPGNTRAKKVPISIKHADAEVEVFADQRPKPPIDEIYVSIGNFRFASDRPGTVTFSTRDTVGYVIVDSVRLIELDDKGKPVKSKRSERENSQLTALESQLKKFSDTLAKSEAALKKLKDDAPAPLERAIAVAEAEKIGDVKIRVRGEHANLGDSVSRGFLQVASANSEESIDEKSSGRKELAAWLAGPDHPLTARVYVNRVWHYLLGQGIVASVDNFGSLGDRPTHPQLLDRLAADFVANNWSTKWLVREIVSSRVYQMSSEHNEESWQKDPGNTLLWRANRKRIPAESIRDSILSLGGKLDVGQAGSPVEGLGTLVTQNNSEAKKFDRKELLCRSTYLPIIRSELPSLLTVFDFADPDLVTGRRAVTNVPAQALLLLNSPFVMKHAENAAAQVRKVAGEDADESLLIWNAYALVLGREPLTEESIRARDFLRTMKVDGTPAADPLAQLVHTLISSTEFRMLD